MVKSPKITHIWHNIFIASWWRHMASEFLVNTGLCNGCCLAAPSHYRNQYWLTIGEVQWQSPKGNFTRDTSAMKHLTWLEKKHIESSIQISKGSLHWIAPILWVEQNMYCKSCITTKAPMAFKQTETESYTQQCCNCNVWLIRKG